MLKSFALRLEEAERDGFLSASQRRVASSFGEAQVGRLCLKVSFATL